VTRLGRLSWSERRKLVKVLRPVGAALTDPRTRRGALIRSIRLLTKATQQYGHEWVYWYTLGDFAQEAAFFDNALHALCCSYHLRPHDPRSLYALATGFRDLGNARLLDRPGTEALLEAFHDAGLAAPNPAASRASLERLGLIAVEAGAAAIHFFGETLALVKGRDRDMVRRHLAALASLFPELTPETMETHLVAPLEYVAQHRP
jgi:hypothetical protein